MAQIGRPTKLTAAKMEKAVMELRRGVPVEGVAALLGISRRTWYDWIRRGARALEVAEAGEALPEEEKPFAELYLAVEKALAEFKADRLAAIQTHEGKEWTAAAWQLERRFPHEFGRRDRMDHRHRHELVVGVGCVMGGDGEVLGMQEYVIADGQQHYRGIRTEDGRLLPPGSEEHDRAIASRE